MANNEDIWLDPGHDDTTKAAVALAHVLGMQVCDDPYGSYVFGGRLDDELPVAVTSLIERTGEDPDLSTRTDDLTVWSGFPLVWSFRCPTDPDEDLLARIGRTLFDRVVAHLDWRAVLTRTHDDVVAAYDPERGRREFPPGTPVDDTGRAVWG